MLCGKINAMLLYSGSVAYIQMNENEVGYGRVPRGHYINRRM